MISLLDAADIAIAAYTTKPNIIGDDIEMIWQEIGDTIVWSSPGSRDLSDWIHDIVVGPWPSANHDEIGIVHGDLEACVASVIDQMVVITGSRPCAIIGHSKAGGTAILQAAHMVARGVNVVQLVAFEAPHVAFDLNNTLPHILRQIPSATATRNGSGLLCDPVTIVPVGFFTPLPVMTLRSPTTFFDPVDYHLMGNVRASIAAISPVVEDPS
jgi:hypothetical protein